MLGLSRFFPFSDEEPTERASLSVVSEHMTFRGAAVSGPGDIRIEGDVRADISMEGRVYVAPGAEIHGSIYAQSIFVAGDVRGRLHACEKLVLRAQAEVHGTLVMSTLQVDAGARFHGSVEPHGRELVPSHLTGDELPAPPGPSRTAVSPGSSSRGERDGESVKVPVSATDGHPSFGEVEDSNASTTKPPSSRAERPSRGDSSSDQANGNEAEAPFGFQW